MMKRILFLLMAVLAVFVLATPTHATLILRGQGTSVHGTHNMIYDDDLDVTWYDFSNAADNWANQVSWADGLSVTFDSATYDDWRLPSTVDGLYVFGYDGTTTAGYNITTSEMGHLFYTELGNKGFFATDGTSPQPGWGLTNTGYFQNLASIEYWSGTEYLADTNVAWSFRFNNGYQDAHNKGIGYYGLAVRSGDVAAAVPEPATIALLGIGLAGMSVYGVIRRRQLRPQVK